jgi:hypothetical protein
MLKLLYNAHIRTLDESTPFASALLIGKVGSWDIGISRESSIESKGRT